MSLQIAVPIASQNVHLLDSFVANLKHQSGLRHHHVLFVASPSCMPQAQAASNSVRECCPEVDVVVMNTEPMGGPSFVFNLMLKEVHRALRGRLKPMPCFYCEPQCTPLTSNCWDALETEYRREQTRFLGCRIAMPPPNHGFYMPACGIWPQEFDTSAPGASALLQVVNKNPPAAGPPMADIYLGHEIMGKSGCFESKLIDFRPGSTLYESLERITNKEAVIHYGCVDGTLAKLLLGAEPKAATAQESGRSASYSSVGSVMLHPEQEDRLVRRFGEEIRRIMTEKPWYTTVAEVFDPQPAQDMLTAKTQTALQSPPPEEWVATATEAAELVNELAGRNRWELSPDLNGRAYLVDIHEILKTEKEITLAEAVARCQPEQRTTQPMLAAMIKQEGSGLVIENKVIRRAA